MADRFAVEIDNLERRFGEVTALAQVSLQVRAGEFLTLLGPSGCGKTTLLRIIAGLEVADAGEVFIDGVNARELPAHRRPVNTVFQSYALFPHMTVWDNVAFGLRMKGRPRAEIEARVGRVLDLMQITGLVARRPGQLSGGQKQRVALARALVNEPKVLLLDEPLGALDLKLRKELQVELLALQRRLGMTFVYVTHDQEEALVMSDRIAVMRDGRIEQIDLAEALYERPRTRFVAQFLGSCNLLEGPCGLQVGAALPEDRSRYTLAIRPEKIALLPASEPLGANRLGVRVEEVIYVGAETHYLVRAREHLLRVEVMNIKVGPQGFDVGQEAVVHLPPEALLLLDD